MKALPRCWLVTLALIFLLAGCVPPLQAATPTAVFTPSPRPTLTATPTATPYPTAVPSPTPALPDLIPQMYTEDGVDPDYTIAVQYPLLDEADSRAGAFNPEVEQLVDDVVEVFKDDIQNSPELPDLESYMSGLDVDYTVHKADPHLVSLLFNLSVYYAGAAHPLPYSLVLTYDFDRSRVLELSDLFQPGADYLSAISDYCIADLKRQGMLEWAEGAMPDPVNYKSWNVTPEGLLITFDPYQVAPYAAGYQEVLIPFAELQGILLEQQTLQAAR